MRIQPGIAFLLACFASVTLSPHLWSQSAGGNLIGTILDSSGGVLPNVTVEAQNAATGVKTTTKTDASGWYRFHDLLVGKYDVKASGTGFGARLLKDVAVELNQTSTVNISLSPGALSTSLEVTAAPVVIDVTTPNLASTYDRLLATDLPLAANPNGGIYNLSLIGAGIGSSGGLGAGTGPSVGGQRPRYNNFTVEGVDNNLKNVTGPLITPPNDAVAEFTVLQNQFSAEFGHSAGGQFNVVIKSGTNAVHGSVYEYLQNRILDANDQAAAREGILSPPRYDQNRVGGEAGGPIKKNKWFIYGLYEYNPIGVAGVPAAPIYAPTQAGYAMLNAMSGISPINLGVLEKFAPPATGPAIKSTAVNGVAIPLGVFQIIEPAFANTYNWLVSSDFNISDRDQLRARYVNTRISGIDAAASLPAFFTSQPTTEKLGSLSELHDFSPNLYNEFRLAFNRLNDDINTPNYSYPGLDQFPNIFIRNDLNLNIGPDPNAPQAIRQTTYQIVNNVSWTKGRHDLKFGFDGRDLMSASTFIQRSRGDYEWTSLQGFLNDTVPNYLAQRSTGSKPYSGNNTAYYFFANDDWRVNHHLTLNLGVRYEFNGVPQSMREFGLNSIADVPGVLTFKAPQPSKDDWAPRLGFAYSPGTSGTTSIRSGFGIGYDPIFDNIGTNVRPPQATSTVDVTGASGTGFLANGGILPSASPASLTPAQARAATSYYMDPVQRLGYALTWNLGVQHSFSKDYSIEVRYIGTKGVHLLVQTQLNRNSLVTPTFNLPTYLQAPTQPTLDSLTLTTATFQNLRSTSAWNRLLPYGFINSITAYEPIGNSEYHGLAVEMKKRYRQNLLFDASYTWSHLIDDGTAEINTIAATPRRPQDFGNLSSEKGNSALDRRQRFTFTGLYQVPWFRGSRNLIERNVLGNWELSGIYTAESGEWATPQSGVDSNQNGDAASDRVIINPNGVPGTASGVTALKNSAGATVAYLAMNPNAQFIQAQIGAYANSGRDILQTPGINNVDFAIQKNLAIRERFKLQLRADLFNALNHPQYTLGPINNVRPRNTSGSANWFIPGNPLFAQWGQVFSSNPRIAQVSAKLVF